MIKSSNRFPARRFAAVLLMSVVVAGPAPAQQPVREAFPVPPHVEAIIRAQMNGHLVSLDALVMALASGDYDAAAAAAQEMSVPRGQDMNTDPSKGPGLGIGRYLPRGFREMGQRFHDAAARYGARLRDPGQRQHALLMGGLAEITTACRACHDAYSFR